jgi:hypothetical protein
MITIDINLIKDARGLYKSTRPSLLPIRGIMNRQLQVQGSNDPIANNPVLRLIRFLRRSYQVTKRTLQRDLKWHRLIEEDEGVIGHAWFARQREHPHHKLMNIVRFITILIFAHLYYLYFYYTTTIEISWGFIRLSWAVEKIELPDAILYRTPGASSEEPDEKERFDPGQFKPRWLIKVTFNRDPRSGGPDVRLIRCTDETDAVEDKKYVALSYSYDDAKSIFRDWYPNVPENGIPRRDIRWPSDNNSLPHVLEWMKNDPMMTAWSQASLDPSVQKKWHHIALRQRNARVFLDCYLDVRYKRWLERRETNSVEYIWLDEFCLYDPEQPSLEVRNEELGRMADIFRFAEAVCVYCPIDGCKHVSKRANRNCQHCVTVGRRCQECNTNDCHWGSRLWTLSEIVHANKVISMTRRRERTDNPLYFNWRYTLTEMEGRNFRAQMQRQAELDGQWHLHAIMRHANNSGSNTWQQAIHSLVVEAILRNKAGGWPNKYIAKALNGLLPRRARPKDLLGKDGWADLAWLLELNQGFYNAASLAAVCGLGETWTQGHGWLGPPLVPAAGNERVEPITIAFPIPAGLYIADPKVIGLKPYITRDSRGMYRTKKLAVFQVCHTPNTRF